MKFSAALSLAYAAASLHAADARVGARRNPLGDAMDALVNEERFFRGRRLHRLLQDDDDADAACESEMETIYSDRSFSRTLFKINMQCSPQVEMTEESFSMTNDYSDCDEEGEFEAACTDLSGVVVAVPDISVSCSLDYEETTYTSSYSMIGGAVCAGASCPQEYDAAEADQTGEEVAAQMESEMAGILAIFGIEGTIDCDVDIGSGDDTGVAIQ